MKNEKKILRFHILRRRKKAFLQRRQASRQNYDFIGGSRHETCGTNKKWQISNISMVSKTSFWRCFFFFFGNSYNSFFCWRNSRFYKNCFNQLKFNFSFFMWRNRLFWKNLLYRMNFVCVTSFKAKNNYYSIRNSVWKKRSNFFGLSFE